MQALDVLIVGGGAAGIAVAASMRRRNSDVSIAIVEPQDEHYYQPASTLVAGGLFDLAKMHRPMARCIPDGVHWIKSSVAAFLPAQNAVALGDGDRIGYRALVVCPGIQLNWHTIEGLPETLGRNGVTSNYRFDLAPYTWQLVRKLAEGVAIFTQPALPIKCPAAPQKALYLSSDLWRRWGRLGRIEARLNIASPALFSVPPFIPTLMRYVRKYDVALSLTTTLKSIDGPSRKAWFEVRKDDGSTSTRAEAFDMIHVVPPQAAPDFVRHSALANEEGWTDVDPATLRHRRYDNIFSLGDACSAPSTKTAAAVRKQAPVVALNVLNQLDRRRPSATYDGYGSCPIVVARGKVLLVEFAYGGRLVPTFPLDPLKPRWAFWLMKRYVLPFVYWDLMLKGREVLAGPQHVAPGTS